MFLSLLLLKSKNINLIWIIIIFFIACKVENKYEDINRYLKNERNEKIVCEVVSSKDEKNYSNEYIIKIKKWSFKYENIKFILYTDKTINLEYGDIIFVDGILSNVQENTNYKGFNYNRYLRQLNIYGVCNANNISYLKNNNSILKLINDLRTECKNKINNNFEKDISSFLNGILLGDMSYISDEMKNDFKTSNLSHILAISGMHVNYVIVFINYIFEKTIPSKKIKDFLTILFILFFLEFTGSSVSCARACIMAIFTLIAKFLYRQSDFYSNLLISLSILLILNPYNIESIGMWLSFLGSFALGYFKLKIPFKNKFLVSILNNFFTCIFTQIIIFPIILYNYNTISLTFFISNILVSYLVGPILILGYLSIIFNQISFIPNVLVKIVINISRFRFKI